MRQILSIYNSLEFFDYLKLTGFIKVVELPTTTSTGHASGSKCSLLIFLCSTIWVIAMFRLTRIVNALHIPISPTNAKTYRLGSRQPINNFIIFLILLYVLVFCL